MSIEITCKIVCNGCETPIFGDVQTTTCQGLPAYWSAMDHAKSIGWVTLHRYGKSLHYCKDCADKPAPKKAAL